MNYTCKSADDGKKLSWECSIDLISRHGHFCEADIRGNGSSFHVIAGPHIHGMFLCIPNWQIGCELSCFNDVFWNYEQLQHHLNPIDSRTIAVGLSLLSDITNAEE